MSQSLPVKNIKWVEYISKSDESFIKSNNEQSGKGYFLKLMFNILKIFIIFTMTYPFCLTEGKLKISKGL